MTALRNQRGTALVAALSIAMILLPLGALVALQARTDLSIQLNLRNEIETFYVADAGVAHAVAEIPPGQSFEQMLVGPDHLTGTSDDGTFPFVDGAPAAFPQSPFRYDVQVVASGDSMLRIVSRASGANGSKKVVEALVTRSPLPFTPAALYTETASPILTLGAGFRLSGIDHQAVLPPVPQAQPTVPLPALSTAHAGAAAALRTALSGAAPEQMAGAAPSVSTISPLDVGSYVNSIASVPTATARPAVPADGATWGTHDAPQLSVVAGDLRVPGRLTGSGVLVVRGSLDVAGTLEFSGLILVQGAIVVEPASTLTLAGALWQAANQDERLHLDGTGMVAYSSSALAEVDRAFPGLLPHAAVLAGWQEDL
ncbi:MAG TPA: hypothetical protein VMW56_15335 [Candidatus Margulisiibacteriota bacterium]|nr:hypothetical protein [Candidatus Margulisiibacteriota bacterium]